MGLRGLGTTSLVLLQELWLQPWGFPSPTSHALGQLTLPRWYSLTSLCFLLLSYAQFPHLGPPRVLFLQKQAWVVEQACLGVQEPEPRPHRAGGFSSAVGLSLPHWFQDWLQPGPWTQASLPHSQPVISELLPALQLSFHPPHHHHQFRGTTSPSNCPSSHLWECKIGLPQPCLVQSPWYVFRLVSRHGLSFTGLCHPHS